VQYLVSLSRRSGLNVEMNGMRMTLHSGFSLPVAGAASQLACSMFNTTDIFWVRNCHRCGRLGVGLSLDVQAKREREDSAGRGYQIPCQIDCTTNHTHRARGITKTAALALYTYTSCRGLLSSPLPPHDRVLRPFSLWGPTLVLYTYSSWDSSQNPTIYYVVALPVLFQFISYTITV
jgi:hypothetical protein